jgi:hypothetical protein
MYTSEAVHVNVTYKTFCEVLQAWLSRRLIDGAQQAFLHMRPEAVYSY